jgi:hypothetical protein
MSYYEDKLSKWYISSNGKHSTFLNQIKEYDLKVQVDSVLDMKTADPTFDTRFEFPVDGNNEKFSVWVDENPTKHKLYRLTPGEDGSYNNNTVTNADSKPRMTTSNKQDFTPKGFFDSKSHDLVTLEWYQEEAAKDYSIRPLTTKEKSPNNYMIMEKGKKQVYLWIGKWIKGT